MLALVTQDMIWRLPGMVPYHSGTYRGPNAVAEFFQKLSANVATKVFEPCEFVAEADRVLVIVWSRGLFKGAGRLTILRLA